MTRENKLAMVVGFGLLLFVGILVSDHFSTAQRQENANLITADKTRERVSRPVSIAAVPVAGVTMAQSAEVMPTTVSNDVRRTSNESPLGTGVPDSAVRPISSAPAAVPETVIAVVENSKKEKVQESEPGVTLHPIAEGETLYSICAKTYGDGSLWKELAEYNKKALPNPANLRKGVTIRLPQAAQLRPGTALASKAKGQRVSTTSTDQKNPAIQANAMSPTKASQEPLLLSAADVVSVEMAPALPASTMNVIEVDTSKSKKISNVANTASSKAVTKENISAASDSLYVVQKGDTLQSIAKKKLGKTSKWKDIVDVNGSSISDPTALKPGTSIKLPTTN